VTNSECCSECAGVRIKGEHCLAHLTATELSEVAEHLRRGRPLDGRSTHLTRDTVVELLETVRSEDGQTRLPAVDFRRTRFQKGVSFAGTCFGGHARFEDAGFEGDALFEGACFEQKADFDRVEFLRRSDFSQAQFGQEADFRGAHFMGSVGEVVNDFKEADFGGPARFRQAHFHAGASFERAVFHRRAELGPMTSEANVLLVDALFEQSVSLDVSTPALSCRGTRFNGRADLNIRRAEVTLDGTTFLERSTLAGSPPFQSSDYFDPVDEQPVEAAAQTARAERGLVDMEQPRLLSVRRASVDSLSLRNVDLSACRFFGANGLDELSIEVDCDFAGPPASWRYTRRRTLAEEHDWRARHGGTDGWLPPVSQFPDWLESEDPAPLDAGEVASVYRSLRKALEDHSDEPGAADFYYGEMEMRRLTKPDNGQPLATRVHSFGERAVLRTYWLVSGYGLRASRAFIFLVATILAGAVLLDAFGFQANRAYFRSLLFATESAISLLRPPPANLTAGGEVVQIALRLIGPLFLGLALLALRGRVKR
jgi:uncharacterized protein YjbI with pentapeptide repeats